MKNSLRILTLLLAVVSLAFFSSCEKDEFDTTGSIEKNMDMPTFAELVTYEKDGSFSATLTGEQMAYIMENEFSEADISKSNSPSMSFAQILLDNAPGAKKGSEGQKSTTYGIVNIAVGMGSGTFLQFEGRGGLTSNASFTKSIDVTISQSTFPMAFAFSFVFTSGGFGYPLAYNDSSFDKVGNCLNWRIRTRLQFNGINNATGFAFVTGTTCLPHGPLPDYEITGF